MAQALETQFGGLLEGVAEQLDIPPSYYEQAEKRYQAIGRWLGREGSTVARISAEVYPQGSFRLGTAIKPTTEADEYDVDLVCELALTKDMVTQQELKRVVGIEIGGYARANGMNEPAEEGRRCWTLNYADGAQFHMDILPSVPNKEAVERLLKAYGHPTDWTETAIAITDRKHPSYDRRSGDWPRSNPKGYSKWFEERMKPLLELRRGAFAKSIGVQVEDVPFYQVRTPLQRAVQILKRHRDMMFGEDSNKPISVILTTLAAHAYNGEEDILEALCCILNKMPTLVSKIGGIAWVPNPVDPLENFADKWQEHPVRQRNFYRWIDQARRDLDDALGMRDIRELSKSLGPKLGQSPVNEALKSLEGAGRRVLAAETMSATLSQAAAKARGASDPPTTRVGFGRDNTHGRRDD